MLCIIANRVFFKSSLHKAITLSFPCCIWTRWRSKAIYSYWWQLDTDILCSNLSIGKDGQKNGWIAALLYAPYQRVGHNKIFRLLLNPYNYIAKISLNRFGVWQQKRKC